MDVPNFGKVSSSIAESGHAYLKLFPKKSNSNIFVVTECLVEALDNQVMMVTEAIMNDSTNMLCNVPAIFLDMNRKVSAHAIKQVLKQYKIPLRSWVDGKKTLKDTCTHTFERKHGYPCWHFLEHLKDTGGRLKVQHFHDQWKLG